MKAELVNRFKYALNVQSNSFYVVFEQQHPELLREPEGSDDIVIGEDRIVEVSSLIMDIPCALDLANGILESVRKLEEDRSKGEK